MWLNALSNSRVWLRAAKWGVPVGLLQAVIDQGDSWMSHTVNAAVVTKTIVSPLVTFSVALASAAGMHIDRMKEQNGRKEV